MSPAMDSTAAADAAAAFPRGGGSGLSVHEYREIARTAERDVLFAETPAKGSDDHDAELKPIAIKDRKRKSPATESNGKVAKAAKSVKGKSSKSASMVARSDADAASASASASASAKPKKLQSLTFKRITVGSTFLAVITDVADLTLTLSLPNHLTGRVRITEISSIVTAAVERVANAEDDSEDEDGADPMSDIDDDADVEMTVTTTAVAVASPAATLPELKRMFRVGQWVQAAVIDIHDATAPSSKTRRKRIDLSLRPEIINAKLTAADLLPNALVPVTILSVEDHGYVVSAGVDGVTGFLHHEHAKGWLESYGGSRNANLIVGQVVSARVMDDSVAAPQKKRKSGKKEGRDESALVVHSSVNASRVVKFSIDPEQVAKSTVADPASSLEGTVAGWLTRALVVDVLHAGAGLLCKIHGMYDVQVDIMHSGLGKLPQTEDELRASYKPGDKITGRILYALAQSRDIDDDTDVVENGRIRLGMSLQHHVLQQDKIHILSEESVVAESGDSAAGLLYGSILESVRIERVEPVSGLYCSITGQDKVLGYVHISRVADEHVAELHPKTGRWAVGTLHRARVLGHDPVDGIIQLTLQPSIIAQSFLRLRDVSMGDVVTGVIKAVIDAGVLVTLTNTLTGLIPTAHLTEVVRLSKPEKKFKEGKTITARVWKVDVPRNRVLLTVKRTLLDPAAVVISSAAEAVPGMIVTTVLSAFVEHGCVVAFNGGMSGLVSRGELGIAADADPRKHFRAGQCVRCRIVSVSASQRIRASFILEAAQDSGPAPVPIDEAAEEELAKVKVGSLVDGDVIAIRKSDFVVRIVGTTVSGSLPFLHLCDHSTDHAQHLSASIAVGQRIQGVLVVSKILARDNSGTGHFFLSKKTLLSKKAKQGTIPLVLQDFKENDTLPGFVTSVMEYGVFVSFLNGVSALVPKSAISDAFVTTSKLPFVKHQSVLVRITQVDSEKRKISATLKHIAANTLQEACMSMHCEEEDFGALDGQQRVGKIVSFKTIRANEFGLFIDCKGHGLQGVWSGFLHRDNIDKDVDLASIKDGEGVILDANPCKKMLDVSMRSELCSIVRKGEHKGKKSSTFAKRISGTVQLVKEDYLVVLAASRPQILIRVCAQPLNALATVFTRFKIGQTVDVEMLDSASRLGYLQSASVGEQPIVYRTVINPIDKSVTSIDDWQLGRVTQAVVRSIKGTQANVELADGIKGRIHVSQILNEHHTTAAEADPLKTLKKGQVVDVKVIGWHDIRTHRFLPISHTQTNVTAFELSMRPSELAQPGAVVQSFKTSESYVGGVHVGYISKILPTSLLVDFSCMVHGRLPLFNLVRTPCDVDAIIQSYEVGTPLKCRVVAGPNDGHSLFLSLPSIEPAIAGLSDITVGMVLPVRVIRIDMASGLFVEVIPGVVGRIYLTDMADTYTENPTKSYKKDDVVFATVVQTNSKGDCLDLSLRPSRLIGAVDAANPEVMDIKQVQENTVVAGYVRSNVEKKGCFVHIGRSIFAQVKIAQLSDAFVADWKSLYRPGQLVQGRIITVDRVREVIEMTLKSSLVSGQHLKTLVDFAVGDIVACRVRRIERFGMFIGIEDTKISGLCHSSEISDEKIDNLADVYSPGDRVKAKIIAIDTNANRISFGLKRSYFAGMDHSDSISDSMDADPSTETASIINMLSDVPALPTAGESAWVGSDDDADYSSENDSQAKARPKKSAASMLQVPTPSKSAIASSSSDFERLVLGSPNDSYIWISYMAFHLQLAEIDQARVIAKRATQAISHRETQERLNVWLSWLNLECKYGDKDSLAETFKESTLACEPKKMYLHLASIHDDANDFEAAETAYKDATKKFGQSCKVWCIFGQFYMRHRRVEPARELLNRALQSLPNRKHVKTIVKFAQLEYKYGEPERGMTIFERIVTSYPKRLDLWIVYIDKEITTQDLERVRRLFQRVTSLKLSSKKMKFFFKKWLTWEKEHGDEEGIEDVKARALAYVQSQS